MRLTNARRASPAFVVPDSLASEPRKFRLPARKSDLRYQWVEAWCEELDVDELRELVIEAWRMCVPKKISALVP